MEYRERPMRYVQADRYDYIAEAKNTHDESTAKQYRQSD